MTENARFRRPPDHGGAVGFCLQVAATNSVLLTQHDSGKSGLHADLNPVAHALRMTIGGALMAAAKHVDAFAEITSRDLDRSLTPEQEGVRAEAVRVLGRELEALAQRSGDQTIAFAEFGDIWVRLSDFGFALKPHHALDVATAILSPDP